MPDVTQINRAFLDSALQRNYSMPPVNFTQAGQVLDIELDSIPGYADCIDLTAQIDLAITVGAGGAAPSMSPFAPFNIFSDIQLSLGGGPFQRVSPFFYALREMISHRGWAQDLSAKAYPYSTGTHYNVPAINAPAGATTDNTWLFNVRIPLQIAHGHIKGHIPMGTASVKAKLRLTVTNNLYGVDQFNSPLNGGTNVSVAVGTAKPSYVAPNISYKTTPVSGQPVTPMIGEILNVQQNAFNFVGAGSLTPIKFSDPFKYLRLYMIAIDGTGAPNTTAVTNLELDLMPGYPQFTYSSPSALASYFQKVRRLYQTDLPTGVFVFDLWSGSDPANPDGNQIIDGRMFQTLQAQIAVSAATNVGSPARVITFAEALSPVAF